MTTRIITGCKKIVGGTAEGEALISSQPINFLAMVEADTGKIIDTKHELYGKSLRGTILIFPNAIGSSVGAYVFHSLKEAGTAPKGIICAKADITTASGCAIGEIPVVDIPKEMEEKPLTLLFTQGSRIKVDADAGTVAVTV
jgi:predicted aconitase with swiveling domain